MSTTSPPRRPPRRTGGGSGGGWAPALTPRTAVRIAILGGIAMSLLGILLVRLWFLQVISGEEYSAKADGNRLRTVITQPARGNILTRDGAPLVQNKIGENLVASPRDLTGKPSARRCSRAWPASCTELGQPVTAKELIAKVKAGDNQPLQSVVLLENIDATLFRYLAERRRDFPGLVAGAELPALVPRGPARRARPGQHRAHRPGGHRRLPQGRLQRQRDRRRRGRGADLREVPRRHARPDRGRGGRRRRAAGPRLRLVAQRHPGPQHRAVDRRAHPEGPRGRHRRRRGVTGAKGAAGRRAGPAHR